MKNARQLIPPPVLTPGPNALAASAQAVNADSQHMAATRPQAFPVAPHRTVTIASNGQIELLNPTIELRNHVFIGASEKDQVNTLRPKRALIVGGVIVIEELNLIVPLEGTVAIRTT